MISTLARPKTLRLAGFAAGAVALAGAAVYVTASAAGYSFNFGSPSSPSTSANLSASPQDAAGNSAVCTDFINHFASDIGSDQSKLNAAYQQAIAQTLADQVKAGKLTQAQADAIEKRLAKSQPCSIGPALKAGARAGIGAYMQQLMAAAAASLGTTTDQLNTDLRNGQSLSQIAAAHNPPITEAQFRTSLIANLKPQLDQAVTGGKLTSSQEQEILNGLQKGPIPFWSKAPKMRATTATPSPA